jgi:glycosyltransferase involved in cell wall biosynthesis
MKNKQKLVRITTVPISLHKLLEHQLSFINKFYDVIAISTPGHLLEKVGHKESIRTFGLELTRKFSPIKDIFATWKLYKFLRKEKPLIIHTHTPKAGIVGMLAAKIAGIPIRLHTVAGLPLLESKGLKRIILSIVERLTYACATKVYPNSFGLKKIIIDNRFCNPSKLKVIANGSSNGIDTSYFNPNLYSNTFKKKIREDLNIQVNDFVFLFVGRLVGDKGINELVKAFEIFQSRNSNSKLILVGEYEDQLDPLLNETINSIEFNSNIIHTGFQFDVRPYFSISNCLVFPSYREGFPNVVMQAGAMGIPAIVTNINGSNEIIEDSLNGVIIPVKNINSILLNMELLYRDKNFFINLKNNSRNVIISKFEQDIFWKELLAEYEFQENSFNLTN